MQFGASLVSFEMAGYGFIVALGRETSSQVAVDSVNLLASLRLNTPIDHAFYVAEVLDDRGHPDAS